MDDIIQILNQKLPIHIIYIIIFKYKAVINPHALILQNRIKFYDCELNLNNQKICWYCKIGNISLSKCFKSFITHKNLNPLQKKVLEDKNRIYLCWHCAH